MNFRKMITVLQQLGFKKSDAEIYIYLAKEGSKTANEVEQDLQMTKKQVRTTLKSLQSRGAITSCSNRLYSAANLDEVIKDYLRKETEIAEELLKNRESLIQNWVKLTEMTREESS